MFNQHAGPHRRSGAGVFALVDNYGDLDLREKYHQDVDNAEARGRPRDHEVNRLLHKTFITPIDREQIHSLINTMDDVADLIPGLGRDHGAVRHPPA